MPLSQVDESLAALETQLRSAAADGSHVKSCSAVHEVLPRLLSDALPSAATDALLRRFTTRTSSPSPSAATNLCWQLARLTALSAYSRSRQWRRKMRCCRCRCSRSLRRCAWISAGAGDMWLVVARVRFNLTASTADLLPRSISFSHPLCLVCAPPTVKLRPTGAILLAFAGSLLPPRLLRVSRFLGEVAIVDARSGATLGKLKQVGHKIHQLSLLLCERIRTALRVYIL
jgi:hypothetical protein